MAACRRTEYALTAARPPRFSRSNLNHMESLIKSRGVPARSREFLSFEESGSDDLRSSFPGYRPHAAPGVRGCGEKQSHCNFRRVEHPPGCIHSSGPRAATAATLPRSGPKRRKP